MNFFQLDEYFIKCEVVFLRKYKSLATIVQLGRKEKGQCTLNSGLQEQQNHWRFLFLFKRENVISSPTPNRNFIKEAELLCMSTGSSLIETLGFVVPCFCIVIVHRSPCHLLRKHGSTKEKIKKEITVLNLSTL